MGLKPPNGVLCPTCLLIQLPNGTQTTKPLFGAQPVSRVIDKNSEACAFTYFVNVFQNSKECLCIFIKVWKFVLCVRLFPLTWSISKFFTRKWVFSLGACRVQNNVCAVLKNSGNFCFFGKWTILWESFPLSVNFHYIWRSFPFWWITRHCQTMKFARKLHRKWNKVN